MPQHVREKSEQMRKLHDHAAYRADGAIASSWTGSKLYGAKRERAVPRCTCPAPLEARDLTRAFEDAIGARRSRRWGAPETRFFRRVQIRKRT
jgi:hypothetical protein